MKQIKWGLGIHCGGRIDSMHISSIVLPSPAAIKGADLTGCSLKYGEFLNYKQAAQYLSVSVSLRY